MTFRLKFYHKVTVALGFTTALLLLGAFFVLPPVPGVSGQRFLWLAMGWALAMGAAFFVLRYSFRPLEEVANMAERMASGDFSRRIFLRTQDEIGGLAESMNVLSEQIESRIREFAREKSRLEAVLLSMFEGILVVDQRRSILLMNQTLRSLFNIKEDALGKTPIEIIRNAEIHEIIEKTLALEKGVYSKEITVLFPVEKKLITHASPIIRSGHTEGAVLVFHDISELRRLEKIRQEFIANVSHELRTPMSSIKGYSETLLEGALEDKEHARDFVKIINDEAGRLARLIEDILDLSRIESDTVPLKKEPCSLHRIVHQAVARLRQEISDKKLIIRNEIPEGFPSVRADEDRIHQVVFNLLDNAVKYTPPEGRITITAQDWGTDVQVNVEDTGIGIPPEDLPRIYERFYRVDKARSRELGGTGLGLSIVKHIIQGHQGEVSVKSDLAKGSVFSFTLPRS